MTEDYSDETRYRILDGGAVYGLQEGRIVAHLPGGKYLITPENARSMLERKRQIGQIAQLRGLARAAGMDLDNATLEEIAKGAGDAIENMTTHFYQVFMKSSNVRGLAEAFRGLTAPMLGEQQDQKTVLNFHEIEIGKKAGELLAVLRNAIPQAVDGRIIDDSETTS
jgi:hypothetical protein